MNPGNTVRPFEYVVLVLTALNAGIGAMFLAGPQFGVTVPGFVLLLAFVFQAMIPVITNRLDALGQPQGASYVQLVNHEGKPVEIPPPHLNEEPLT